MKPLVFAMFALLAASSAHATTRSFFTPMAEGQRVGACLSDGTTCGKAVADQFCQKEGFAESILFARESALTARLLDSGGLCEGESCQAFKRIKCYQPLDQITETDAPVPSTAQ